MKNRLHYPQCLIANHQTQPLSRICIQQQCQQKTLICCICEQQSHKSHKTIPLKVFLQRINNNQNNDNENNNNLQLNPLYYSNKIENIKIKYLSTIKTQKMRILQYFEQLQDQGQIYFKKIQQLAISLINIGNPLHYVISQFTSSSQSQRLSLSSRQYFSHLMQYINFSQKQPFDLKNQLLSIITSCEQKQKKLQLSIDIIKLQIDKNISKILLSLDQYNNNNNKLKLIKKQPEFKWSEILKGHKVKIIDMIAEQTNMESSGQRFALIQPGLSQYGKRKQSWGIKIKKFVGWVGLGICLRNPIKTANYHFNYTNIGHGSYLISSNGYSWSHSVKQFNSAFKTFQFAVNDIVYVEYDPQNSILRFRKNQTNDKFQLTILPSPNDDQYHPCVNLCSTGDSVEIVTVPNGIFI